MAEKRLIKKKVLVFGPYKKGEDKPLPGGIARWTFNFLNSPLINELSKQAVLSLCPEAMVDKIPNFINDEERLLSKKVLIWI